MTVELSDRALIERYVRGDGPAFSELVRRHQRLVYNICFRVAGPTDAEDLTQEVFIRLLDKVTQWRGDSKFTTWLYRLTLNHCRDALRRRRPDTVEVDERFVDPGPRPERTAESREIADRVTAALMELPLDYRAVVFLRDIEGFAYGEIAEILEIELGTVKSRLARARSRLCGLLEPISPAGHQRV